MSSGYASPEVTFVDPFVDFPSPDALTGQVADSVSGHALGGLPDGLPDGAGEAVGEAVDGVGEAVGEVVDGLADQLLDLVAPALLGLGALSGALLAGRAAMVGTQALAAAALRASEAQQTRTREAERAEESRLRWQDAAFAVCRANARLAALRARIRQAGPWPGPGGPPGGSPEPPSLPPALDPVGLSLDRIHAWLAETDRAARRAEADLAVRALAPTPPGAREPHAARGPAGPREDLRAAAARRLRARRERALAQYAAARTEGEARRALPPYSSPLPNASALTADRAAEMGEELLAGLDPAVPAEACARIQEQLAHAVELARERPADALQHLSEARQLAYEATWRAADRREAAEWAAQQRDVLRRAQPGTELAPPEVLAALERIVENGGPVDPRLRAETSVLVAARQAALERTYVAQLLRRQIAEAAQGARMTVRRPAPGVELIEWAPPEWGTEHWLRLALDAGGTVRVQTVHRPRDPGEESDADRALDRERCRAAGRFLARLADRAASVGITLDLAFDGGGTVAGTGPGPAGEADRRPAPREAPAARHLRHEDEVRRTPQQPRGPRGPRGEDHRP
ncbi:hypothetical protein [Streptomyces hoynatensis]|uniref:hypothetical protein n=1 Tax=Streptomyces hoynatensis TaxID=1141874 RepID=UPI0011C3C16F|nr:hypothetical protein [Streptomyces hoynatensis]